MFRLARLVIFGWIGGPTERRIEGLQDPQAKRGRTDAAAGQGKADEILICLRLFYARLVVDFLRRIMTVVL